jgi:hypothetical protein
VRWQAQPDTALDFALNEFERNRQIDPKRCRAALATALQGVLLATALQIRVERCLNSLFKMLRAAFQNEVGDRA